ncbi:hypothetical protein AYO22_11338 [Fonsecaea multimorphosa]|nr:hypothetical protein AYO22_11338 [Fonsecaea multimorphosa]
MDVAVVGLGAFGLVALKNLREEGFNATGFDRNDYNVGDHPLDQSMPQYVLTSVEATIVNISKERGCFTDFPFPKGKCRQTSSHASAADVQKYLADYAAHYELLPHVQLGVDVLSVIRDDGNKKWVLNVSGANTANTPLSFDKVVVASGTNHRPVIPVLKGQESPSDYRDKRVMVVGLGNSAADTATSLVSIAKKILLSHRHGAYMIPRSQSNGEPLDHILTYRKTRMSLTMQRCFPRQWEAISNKMLGKIQTASFKLRPEWRINPAPSVVHNVPTVTDTLIPALEKGVIESVEIATEITGDFSVKLADGKVVEVDIIIWCTGYHVDYSIVGEFDPTLETCHTDVSNEAVEMAPPTFGKRPTSNSKPFEPPIPRLYQNLLSLTHPDSLAFLGTAAIPSAAFQIYDLATMAIAQLWKPDDFSPSLPSRLEMITWVRQHLNWANGILARGGFNTRMVNAPDWSDWLDTTSGCLVTEHLGYGRKGWTFWWYDRKFCNLLMDGIYSPHVYRLFDSHGRRKAWGDAKEAIIAVNEEAERKADAEAWHDLASKVSTQEAGVTVERMVDRMNEILSFAVASGILDNGCGSGTIISHILARYGNSIPAAASIMASDYSKHMLDKLARTQQANISAGNEFWERLQLLNLDAHEMSRIADSSVSHVTGGHLYFLLSDPRKALSETRRIMKKDGVLALSSGKDSQHIDALQQAVEQVRPGTHLNIMSGPWFSKEGVENELLETGFVDVETMLVESVLHYTEHIDLAQTLLLMPIMKHLMGSYGEDEKRHLQEKVVENLRGINPAAPGSLKGTSIIAFARKR